MGRLKFELRENTVKEQEKFRRQPQQESNVPMYLIVLGSNKSTVQSIKAGESSHIFLYSTEIPTKIATLTYIYKTSSPSPQKCTVFANGLSYISVAVSRNMKKRNENVVHKSQEIVNSKKRNFQQQSLAWTIQRL